MFICSVDMAAFSENADLLGFCINISGIHRENINCAVVVFQADVLPRYGKSNCVLHTHMQHLEGLQQQKIRCQCCQIHTGNWLQFAQTHQNWTTEDWRNLAWSDES